MFEIKPDIATSSLPAFECEACGECCRHIHLVPELAELYDSDTHACTHLNGNICEIYEDRPDVCSYQKLYLKLADQYTPEEYHRISVLLCEEIKQNKCKG